MRLLDRDAELEMLGGMFAACDRGSGRVALITGAPAAGKTALVQAFAEKAIVAGALFLDATASRSGPDLPLGVVGQLFSNSELDSAVTERARDLLADATLRVTSGAPAADAVDQVLGSTFVALRGVLLDSAASQPLLIAVDGVGEADILSCQFLLHLARRASTSRLLILLTDCGYLAKENPPFYTELSRQPQFRHIQLSMLSQGSIARMFEEHADPQTADQLAAACYAATGGNPLLVRGLIEDYCASAMPSRELLFGDAFNHAVLTCLFRCRRPVLSVARALAMLGEFTTPELLGEVIDLDSASIIQAVAMLQAAGLLAHGRFRHAASSAAILDALPLGLDEDMHAPAVSVLRVAPAAAPTVARPSAASPAQTPRTPDVLCEAAEQARCDGDVSASVSYLRLAYRLSAAEHEKLTIECLLAQAEWRASPSGIAQHPPEHSPALREGCVPAQQVIRGTADHEGTPELDSARLLLGVSYPALVPDAPGGESACSVPSFGPPLPQQRAIVVLAAALTKGTDEEALIDISAILHEAEVNDTTVFAAMEALAALVAADEYQQASDWCQTLRADPRVRQTPTWRAIFASVQAAIEIRVGNVAVAEQCAEDALSCLSVEGWGVAIGGPLASMLQAKTAMGKYDEAASCLQIPVPDVMFHTAFGLRYLHARSRYFLATGQPQAGLVDIQAYGEGLDKAGLHAPGFEPWQADAAQAYVAMGKISEARHLLIAQLAQLPPEQKLARGKTLRVLAATREPQERPRVLREAIGILQQGGDRLELALAYAELSTAHRSLGEYKRARMMAGLGNRLAVQCGVGTLTAETRPPAEGSEQATDDLVAELTDAQSRVAQLAASAYTNRQIAAKLFITVSTVEQHLTSIYRKLQVGSRSELMTKRSESVLALTAPRIAWSQQDG